MNRKALKKLNKLKSNLSLLDFDEVNVINGLKSLYGWMDDEIRKLLRALYCERYTELYMWVTGNKPSEDMLDELVDMYLAGMLEEPNELTHYVFENESVRKRDRAIEDTESEPTRIQKQLRMEKHLRYWLQMAAWYTDMVSQDAEYQAMKDVGAVKVKWNIYGDDKVCRRCSDLDGEIFLIDKVPPRPHLNCRCWLSLV